MNKRPLSVTVVACLYIATGAIGLVSHLAQFRLKQPFQYDIALISFVSLLAVIAGVFMLRGMNWARWLALAWIVFHVVLSAFHSLPEFAMHAMLCVVFGYFLFRRMAAEYFRAAKTRALG